MRLINCNRHYLNVNNSENRWLHLATVHHNTREFMCFADTLTSSIYIEEITGGHLQFIFDESLSKDISDFLTRKRILDVSHPLLSDNDWLKNKNKNTKYYI